MPVVMSANPPRPIALSTSGVDDATGAAESTAVDPPTDWCSPAADDVGAAPPPASEASSPSRGISSSPDDAAFLENRQPIASRTRRFWPGYPVRIAHSATVPPSPVYTVVLVASAGPRSLVPNANGNAPLASPPAGARVLAASCRP